MKNEIKTLYFTEDEQKSYLDKSLNVEIKSGFGFLNSHNGLRRGSVHAVIGTPGGGKSTLVRSLIRDFLFRKENIEMGLSIQLSEETCDEYKSQLVFGMPASDTLLRGVMFSEEENQKEDIDYFLDKHRIFKPDLLIYDNLTTSRFYEGTSIKGQKEVFTKIKKLTKEINCATVVIAHTGAEVSDGMDRLIGMNDIRGSKAIPNMAEFFYILQRFKDDLTNEYYPTIRTVKHRGQDLIQDMYFLHYQKETRSFVKDSAITWNMFTEMHKKRQRIGR